MTKDTATQPLEPCVKLSLNNGIARVVLNRPEHHNSLDTELVTALLEVLSTLNSSRDLRVVILSGSNHNFCSGLDMVSMMEIGRASCRERV